MDRHAYFLVVPLIGLLAVVEAYPLAYSVYLSVTNTGIGGAFVGLTNYAQLFSQPDFWAALSTSVVFSSGSTVLSIVLGVLFAYLLTLVRRGRGFFEAILLMPLAAAPIVAGVAFAPSGFWDDVNTFSHYVLGQPYFNVASNHLFLPIMVLSDSWEWGPMMMLVALSVLASVPRPVYEASEAFGASRWRTFRTVGLPAILNSPVMHFMIIIRFVDAMRAFESLRVGRVAQLPLPGRPYGYAEPVPVQAPPPTTQRGDTDTAHLRSRPRPPRGDPSCDHPALPPHERVEKDLTRRSNAKPRPVYSVAYRSTWGSCWPASSRSGPS